MTGRSCCGFVAVQILLTDGTSVNIFRSPKISEEQWQQTKMCPATAAMGGAMQDDPSTLLSSLPRRSSRWDHQTRKNIASGCSLTSTQRKSNSLFMAIHNNRSLPIICIPIFARTHPTHFWNVVNVVALPLDCLQSSLKLALVCVSIPSWECSVLRSEKSSGVIPLANSAPSTKPPFASTYGGIFKTIQQTPRSLGLGTCFLTDQYRSCNLVH